ncbi:hypothetical protein MNBD_ALPHA12-2045 [hydrothermal vent metagenome]|uniref:DUF2207 domain-containing protein n=1 Tax=hydrothermal vent metagenome TaxID=652676 RepID=A0A3B0TXG3_9ZZZZ
MRMLNFKHWRRFVAVLLVIWLGAVLPAIAAETIFSMNSDINVLKDGSVSVTEKIVVSAEGKQIKRGIFRDIPTVLVNDDGSTMRSKLTIISVNKNGKPEPFFTKAIKNGTRIYIGDSNVYLKRGTYIYSIRYTMTRMARYFSGYDEIYWNATGNFWSFPIETAVARVTLPAGAKIREINVYTGPQGSNASDAKSAIISDNEARFQTTRILSPGEGMTIAVLFDKGVLAEPDGMQKTLYFLEDHSKSIVSLGAFFLVLAYYYFAWSKVGRDPKKGVIIPLFYPPKDFSPALTHYVHRMGWSKNAWLAFSAALVSLGVKGLVEISKDKKKTVLTATGNSVKNLPSGEAVINDYLVEEGEVKINRSSGPALDKTRLKFKKAIERENQRAYFVNNPLYVIAGFVISLFSILALIIFASLNPVTAVSIIALGVIAGFFASAVKNLLSGGGLGSPVSWLMLVIISVNVFGFLAATLTNLYFDPPVIAAFSIIITNVVFVRLMQAPTVMGRKIMDQIDGFKLYLETAEKDRLNFRKEPEFSVERFERFLPYAIALGVEKPWSERLEGELSRNTLADAQNGYHPRWYHGSDFTSSSISRGIAGISAGMSAAMMAAQPSSSSSSGGGGGGSSGGGGGGGGGGGW